MLVIYYMLNLNGLGIEHTILGRWNSLEIMCFFPSELKKVPWDSALWWAYISFLRTLWTCLFGALVSSLSYVLSHSPTKFKNAATCILFFYRTCLYTNLTVLSEGYHSQLNTLHAIDACIHMSLLSQQVVNREYLEYYVIIERRLWPI